MHAPLADEMMDPAAMGALSANDDGGIASRPEPIRAKLWRQLAVNDHMLKSKEMKEACAFYDSIRKDVRRSSPQLIVDVCGGHGALGMLCIAHGVAPRACIIDQLQPTSHRSLYRAWRPFLGNSAEPVQYDERPLHVALPEVLAQESEKGGRCFVVACHACQHLSRSIIDICIAAGADFAVCPCCPKDHSGRFQAAADALGVDFSAAMVLAEMGRIGASCDVRLRTFDSAVSPHNRVLLGRVTGNKVSCFGYATEVANTRLRNAYVRAQGKPPSGHNEFAAKSILRARTAENVFASDSYEEQLRKKCEAIASLMEKFGETGVINPSLLKADSMEVRKSPSQHFRARTVVSVGESRGEDGDGLFRFVTDDFGKLCLKATLHVETLLQPIVSSLPIVAELLSSGNRFFAFQRGLRCVKFHATLGGTPPQLLVCFIFGPDGEPPSSELLEPFKATLQERLLATEGAATVIVMSQAKGVQHCMPEGHDYVDERLVIAGRDAPLRYRQPFGSFSNPNPHVAIATAEWLSDVIKAVLPTDADGRVGTDLLELYCGAGSHTVALAPLFRHVLAVEINRGLVEAAQRNVGENGLENVTLIRAPSEDFCKRVLKRRSYEVRNKAGDSKLQLQFGCTIVDPPRAGLDALTLEAVANYDHILYVSCNPEALRRDVESLNTTHLVDRLVLLDHFPFSMHAEVAVYLRRREALPHP